MDNDCTENGTIGKAADAPKRPETGVEPLSGFIITFTPDNSGLGYDNWPVTFSISYDEANKLYTALGVAINA